ncbi:MAG TPA: hypothetical protein VEN31_02500 [Candidatus Bathyarchaeia archaeon]|nr:hypothetical protein [Candidatus Bathyarchaeia archaeon]
MSSDLRDLIRSDLELIPLPPNERWTTPRARGRGFMSAGVIAIVLALVVVGSLGGGQALQALRDQIERNRSAGGGAVVPGDDYVFVSDGGPSQPGASLTQGVQVIAMPLGQSIRRFVGNTYVGSPYEGGLMAIRGDRAFLPVAIATDRVGEYEIYLQEIDLNRGLALRRVPLGFEFIPDGIQAELPGTPAFPAATAVSSDGTSIWLVRDTNNRGQVTVVDRFDGQTLSPLAHIVLSTTGPGAVRSHVVALGADRLAVVREHFESQNRGAVDWYFLDPQLEVIASYADDSGHRLPAGGECSADVQRSPANAEWLVLCSDSSLSGDGALVFLDPNTFTISATVSLPRERGFAIGMASATDGTVYVLSDRPVVARIDARTHRSIDARVVTQARSWFDQLLPQAAAAKTPGGPSVVFSPDGRYAYLAGGSVARIDMRDARVIAHTTSFGSITAVGLSPGGERLYALAIDGDGVHRIVLIEPDNLRFVSQSAPLVNDPSGILAVRRQIPAGQ